VAASLTPGAVLQGQFLVGRVLEVEGTYRVYLGRDLHAGEQVEISEYGPVPFLATRWGISREEIQSELQQVVNQGIAIGQLPSHPNVAPIIDAFEHHGAAYWITPFFDGIRLDRHLESMGGRLRESLVLPIILKVLEGLEALHRGDYLFRCLTPASIFLSNQGEVKLIGFRPASIRFSADIPLQSRTYLPQECFLADGKCSPETDLYATGAIIFKTLTGKRLNQANETDDGALPIEVGDLERVAVSANVVAAITKALAPDPLDRFQNAAEMRYALVHGLAKAHPKTSKNEAMSIDEPVDTEEPEPEPIAEPVEVEEPEPEPIDEPVETEEPEPEPIAEPVEVEKAEPEPIDEPVETEEPEPEPIDEPVDTEEPEPEPIDEPVETEEPEPEPIDEPVETEEPEPEQIAEPVEVEKAEPEPIDEPVETEEPEPEQIAEPVEVEKAEPEPIDEPVDTEEPELEQIAEPVEVEKAEPEPIDETETPAAALQPQSASVREARRHSIIRIAVLVLLCATTLPLFLLDGLQVKTTAKQLVNEAQVALRVVLVSDIDGQTWIDSTSGLVWQVSPANPAMDWLAAKTFCSNLRVVDHDDWRLPKLSELRSLVRGCAETRLGGSCRVSDRCLTRSCWEEVCVHCAVHRDVSVADEMPRETSDESESFLPTAINGGCCQYWSSSPVANTPNRAWLIDFSNGAAIGNGHVSYQARVRCVR
jgi:serine/threonine protein kinase